MEAEAADTKRRVPTPAISAIPIAEKEAGWGILGIVPPSPPSERVTWFLANFFLYYFGALEQDSPRERLLHSAMEHLNLAIQGQTSRQSRPAESSTLLYADVCMLLAEGSEEARKWAGTSYDEVSRARAGVEASFFQASPLRYLPSFFFARRIQHFLPSSTRVELCLTHMYPKTDFQHKGKRRNAIT